MWVRRFVNPFDETNPSFHRWWSYKTVTVFRLNRNAPQNAHLNSEDWWV